MLTMRSIKVEELMRTVGAESHLMTLESPAAVYEEHLERPMHATIMRRIDDLRGVSAASLQGVLE